MAASILVLVVMNPDRRGPLVEVLESSAIPVLAVGSCQEAREVLNDYPGVEVVITELTHGDGNWCDLLKWVVDRSLTVSVVVSCEADTADARLWSEVLWRGAYDLLGDPHENSEEVRRSVEGAARAARAMAHAHPPPSRRLLTA